MINASRCIAAIVASAFAIAPVIAQEPVKSLAIPSMTKEVAPFLKQHCVHCHGPMKQAGKFRLDLLTGELSGKANEAAKWQAILERLATGEMPPKEEPRPKRESAERVVALLVAGLRNAGVETTITQDLAYPQKGNSVDHDMLFGDAKGRVAGGDPRVWRISPYIYRGTVSNLTHGKLNQGKAKGVPSPFGLAQDHGFRDYAFRYKVSSSEIEQLAANAKKAVETMLKKQPPRYSPPKELSAITQATSPPTEKQLQTAVEIVFSKTLSRPPSAKELERYTKFVAKNVKEFGNHDGLVRGLAAVLLHPEAIYRLELTDGPADEHGRRMLAPTELARALAFALTDAPPDAALTGAAVAGRLKSNADARREVDRLLKAPANSNPRLLRFFQEYFGYSDAPEVFKDDYIIKAAKVGKHYTPEKLVEDTDHLILAILAQDRDVLRELLTTNLAVVDVVEGNRLNLFKKSGRVHPFDGNNKHNHYYGLAPELWKNNVPAPLPKDERAGILTQPSWLIAMSTNTDNHAILRGKWIRERLLGGQIPDTPITVDAQLPDEPNQPLRHRMRVTRETYCWKCHERMDPLGLAFQTYDGFGRFRTEELGKPVDASGAIVASGDGKLDGPVPNAVQMIRKLADSERVEQVFVRHAFRYWMGRNETLDDAGTLQDAHRAYKQSGGSMKALVASLLSSDSFLYRRAAIAKQ